MFMLYNIQRDFGRQKVAKFDGQTTSLGSEQ